MTNAREIKIVYGPVTRSQPDTIAVGSRFLWVTPVNHVARRIYINSTTLADCAAPRWCIDETFLLKRSLIRRIGTYGFYYQRDPPGEDALFGECWQWSDPTMVPQLIALIENEALPFLRSLDTLERYAACYRSLYDRSFTEHREDRMIVDIALGDLDTARASCLDMLPKYRENKNLDWDLYQSLRTEVVTVAEPLMAGDRAALAAILHGWEADNIRGTPLEPYWESTPFPLETP